MQLESSIRSRKLNSPAAQLAVALAVALALAFAPRVIGQTARNTWREVLQPGQLLLNGAIDLATKRGTANAVQNAQASSAAEEQIARLNEQVRQLNAELLMAQSGRSATGAVNSANSGNDLPPLLVTQTISARVLGRQSKAFLQSREMLNIGKTRGVAATSLVVDGTKSRKSSTANELNEIGLVDQGRDAALDSGRLVLAGSRVWGKIAEVGPHTSTVQRATDTGYRDLVQLTTRREGRLQFAARGVLVGQGTPLCKIELVDATAPVTVGDLVYTVNDGALEVPLLYGQVSRLERKPGAAHWEIWMEPALPASAPPERVFVLKTELNASRFAGGK